MSISNDAVEDENEPLIEVQASQYAAIPEEVLFSDLSSHGLRLYAILQFRGGRKGQSWYSIRKLAEQTPYEEATVKRALRELVEKGWLRRVQRRRDDGAQQSSLYILWPKFTAPNTQQRITGDLPPRITGDLPPDHGRSTETTKGKQRKKETGGIKDSLSSQQLFTDEEAETESSANDSRDVFEEIWKVYPRKVDKQRTRKTVKARLNEGVTSRELLEAATLYGDHVRKTGVQDQFVLHGSTFFGASARWEEWLPDGAAAQEAAEQEDEKFYDLVTGEECEEITWTLQMQERSARAYEEQMKKMAEELDQ